MSPVQEAYEELILRDDKLILQIKTSEWTVSILIEELLYRQRGNTCEETVKQVCEWIHEQEARLRRELFAIRWEKTKFACEFPNAKKQAEVSKT